MIRAQRITGAASLLLGGAVSLAFIVRAPHVELQPAVLPELLRFEFAVTPLALPFLFIIGLIAPAVALWSLKRGEDADGLRLALFSVSMMSVLLSQSIAAFTFCWETMSLVSAFLVATHHERRTVRRAVFAYVLVSQLGALCIVVSFALLGAHAGSGSFARIASAGVTLSPGTRAAALALALLGFGSKAGLVPLQFWLPRAHPAAPAGASAMLSGVMLKIAVYGLLLVCFVLAAPAPWAFGVALLAAGAASAILGALYAAIESEMKRLLANSSIENLGIVAAALGLAVLAAAANQPALAALAILAVLFHSISHAAFKTLLFLGTGTLLERVHQTSLDQLGGLAYGLMRRSAPSILVACMAAAALPPFIGFASEWLVFNGFIKAIAIEPRVFGTIAAIAIAALALSGGLAAAAFIKTFGIGFLGAPRHERAAKPEDVDASVFALASLAAVCLAGGAFPALFVRPLSVVAAQIAGSAPIAVPQISLLPAIALLPAVGAAFAFALAARRGVREAGTWTCGSAVTTRSQYTASVLLNPLRVLFGSFSSHGLFDNAVRATAAFMQQLARRVRIVQSGLLRVYLAYALVAFMLALTAAR